jgi:hypothetical protein
MALSATRFASLMKSTPGEKTHFAFGIGGTAAALRELADQIDRGEIAADIAGPEGKNQSYVQRVEVRSAAEYDDWCLTTISITVIERIADAG